MSTRLVAGLALTLIVVVFVVQNAAAVEVRFLVWTFSASQALLLFFAVSAGVLGGWIGHALIARRLKGM